MTWNADGTLGSLNITDPFNAANTQSCAYSYDDLARIASGNCGSVWSQTFTYDAFGNITKTGSNQFQPGYNWQTNQMSSGASYDSNGDVLSDSLHSYAWNSDTRPTTIDSVTVTYDALGRMVEQSKSGTNTEIVYAPLGNKLALMNGTSTLKQAFAPLPAGATAVYNASGLQYYRHPDWLGNSRFSSTPRRTMYNDLAFAPFGEQYAQAGSTGVTDTSFAGNNEDTTTNLYDAQFREYGIQGRWPSPDPAGVAAANPANPQSWNRYAYVLNNPLLSTDPSGEIEHPQYYEGNLDELFFSLDWADGGGGAAQAFSCALQGEGIDQCLFMGDDIFDALDGAPGTSVGLDMYGNLTWSFSIEKWFSDEASLEDPGTPQSPPSSPNACEQQNLNAVNNQFGTGFTSSNVEGMFQYSTGGPAGTGTLNLDISVPPQYQSNGISPGRYPVNWWSYIIGYGATLHIPAAPGGLDSTQTLVFSNSQFTEHLDSAFPYNPFGFLIHLFEDVFGVGGHRQCP